MITLYFTPSKLTTGAPPPENSIICSSAMVWGSDRATIALAQLAESPLVTTRLNWYG
jgi:hypothetical protein